MTLSTSQINKNFHIKVHGVFNGRKVNTLVGVSGLIRMVGEEFAEKFSLKAWDMMTDSQQFKLRRGLRVTFYIK